MPHLTALASAMQVLYRSTSCSDANMLAALQSRGSASNREVDSLQRAPTALPITDGEGAAAYAVGLPPQSAATDADVVSSPDLAAQCGFANEKLSAAAKTLVRAISAHPLSAPALSHIEKTSAPDVRATAAGIAADSRSLQQLAAPIDSAFATAATGQPAAIADAGAEVVMPPLRLAMPTASDSGQQPVEAEPSTPTRATGAAAAGEPQEQGSAESYNSEQGFGSPVRKRHGTQCLCVPLSFSGC